MLNKKELIYAKILVCIPRKKMEELGSRDENGGPKAKNTVKEKPPVAIWSMCVS